MYNSIKKQNNDIHVVMVSCSVLCLFTRLAGTHEQEGRQCLFKDEADLTVAVKYMKENGNSFYNVLNIYVLVVMVRYNNAF